MNKGAATDAPSCFHVSITDYNHIVNEGTRGRVSVGYGARRSYLVGNNKMITWKLAFDNEHKRRNDRKLMPSLPLPLPLS
jgi:hypothetical protein